MLKYIKEAGKYVEFTGFRKVDINNVEEFVKVIRNKLPRRTYVQFFDSDLVATWQHLYFSVLNALLAFISGRNISKSVPIEIILYASAQRQISKAIELIGVKNVSKNVAVVIICENSEAIIVALSAVSKCIGMKPDESVLELTNEKIQHIRKVFKINNEELEAVIKKKNFKQALVNLVIEKVALLSTQI